MITTREEAYYDVIAAMAEYARKDAALAHRFLDALDNKIANIELFPFSYPIKIHNEYRRAVLTNFPYSIYYKVEPDNEVVISAVLANSIDPKIILKKII